MSVVALKKCFWIWTKSMQKIIKILFFYLWLSCYIFCTCHRAFRRRESVDELGDLYIRPATSEQNPLGIESSCSKMLNASRCLQYFWVGKNTHADAQSSQWRRDEGGGVGRRRWRYRVNNTRFQRQHHRRRSVAVEIMRRVFNSNSKHKHKLMDGKVDSSEKNKNFHFILIRWLLEYQPRKCFLRQQYFMLNGDFLSNFKLKLFCRENC